MSAHRFFLTVPLPDGDGPVIAPLSSADLHHAVSVLRVRPGEQLELVEPAEEAGGWLAEVVSADASGVTVLRGAHLLRSYQPRVTLVQGVAKGDKMDLIVRQAVEIGAAEIVPVLTARSIVKLDERKRAERGERWRRIAESAAKQAHRDFVPAVADPVPLSDALSQLAGYDAVVVLWEDDKRRHLRAAVESFLPGRDARIALVVGPEGGLAAEEIAALEEIGAVTSTLGDSILRTETAAMVALALVLHAGPLAPLGDGWHGGFGE